MSKRIKVLIVDDSLFMRAAIKKILDGDQRLEVIGTAKDGLEGVERVVSLKPDVVTMDFNMPKMDGAQAVREIMKRRPTPVVMVSSHTREGARETFEALSAGAVDFLTKPSGEVSADMQNIGPTLIAKVLGAAVAMPRPMVPATPPPPKPLPMMTWPPSGPRVVIIGVSTGGPAALSRVIPALPGDVDFAIIVVQHMPHGFTSALAERLNSQSAIVVQEAKQGDRPRQGLVLVAPGDRHMEFGSNGVVQITDGAEVNGCRPSVDVTMKSGAKAFGRRAAGVIMTGMGKDGAEGMSAIKAAGGKTLAQDRDSCVIYGMPRAAVEAGAVDDIVPLDDIAPWLLRK
jgi:two-component system, chemotaxis family, protein-glutamate methylesterase/glutaminase